MISLGIHSATHILKKKNIILKQEKTWNICLSGSWTSHLEWVILFHQFTWNFHNVFLISWIIFPCVNVSYFPHPFISWWTSRLLSFSGSVNRIVMSKTEQISLHLDTMIFKVYAKLKSGMSGLFGRYISRFWRKLHTEFHCYCTNLYFYHQWINLTFSHIHSRIICLFICLVSDTVMRVRWNTKVHLICIWLMTKYIAL